PITFDHGHIDAFNVMLDDENRPLLVLNEDFTGSHVKRTAETVELFVKPEALRTTGAFTFPPGIPTPFHYLPYNQNMNLIWPGWDTNGLKPVFGNDVDTGIEISSVDGPGTIYLWYPDDEGSNSSLDGGGFTLPATIRQSFPSHTHQAWGFTAPGTYKVTAQAHVEGNGLTASSNVATYTFVVAERTKLTPQAPAQVGNTVTIPAQDWVTYTDGSGNVLTGDVALTGDLTVNAALALGFDMADGATASWSFEYEAPVAQALSITGLAHHYHQNAPIVLNAVAAPAVDGASYEWFVQRTDQPAPVRVAGQSGAELRITAEQALDGARVTANLLDAENEMLASADAVTIDVDDHGAAPLQQVTLSGAAHHYHTGATAHLAASVSPVSVLSRYEWQVRLAGEADWSTVAGENDDEYSFEVASALDGAHVRAVLTFDDGTHYVASAPIEIEIDDHHDEEPVETVLSITGLAHHYHSGDAANLTAVQNPVTGEDHYHWFIKRQSETAYTVIPGALTADLAYTVTAEDQGAEIIVRLYDHDHGVIAESAPVVIEVDDHHDDENPAPTDPPATPAENALSGIPAGGIELDKSSVEQGGVVRVQVGEGTDHAGEWVAAWMFSTPVLLTTGNGGWQQVGADGTILVRIPASATPGTHSIAVYDAAGALIGWQSIQVRAGDFGTAGAKGLSTTGSDLPGMAIGGIALLVLGAGAVLMLARRRSANEGTATEE
ncbi:MAG: choice-of-anchor M domain-containing protein, partial [Leucobacter sp.]